MPVSLFFHNTGPNLHLAQILPKNDTIPFFADFQ